MDLATGAIGSLLPKLVELLNDEYNLQKSVKEGVRSLEKEMKSMHAALRVVGEVPQDQLDEQVKLWAGEVRELSFDMENVVDKFLVRVDDGSEPTTKSNKLKRLTERMAGLFTRGKARHEIADAIKDINKQVQKVANRRARYTVDSIVARYPAVRTIDPRLGALYKQVTDLVGVAGKRDEELMKLLSEGDDETNKKLKIVSVVGFRGLGKTTLVKTVYDKIKGDFDCRAFVPVGRSADPKKVFMDILLDLGMYESMFTLFDERELIDKLRESLENKRYLIVIDDILDEKLWNVINMAFSSDNNFGSRLITTTRIVSVSKFCCSSTNGSVYQMKPLSDDDSKSLFYKRIFSHQSVCPPEFEKVSIDILKKCGGVPLAIITIASILASDQQVKPEDEWRILLESIGRGLTEDPSVDEMLKILSLSYYDLPSHLKTCLLYISMFPEDYEIKKARLIWMWIAESFVHCEKSETSLFEIGENYFNELVNRNMLLPIYNYDGTIEACRVHDMFLDLICSLSSKDNFVTVLNGDSDSMPPAVTRIESNPNHLPLQHFENITNNFSEERIIGRGGFGVVYKGVLQDGEMVAVKKILQSMPSSEQQFENEVNLLMELNHPNVVRLVGYCYETKRLHTPHEGKFVFAWNTVSLLCLEYLPNGSLDKYISDASSGLDWHTRHKIIEGVSYGLQYLHEQSNGPIIHLDLKPANILLDENMVAKITDFGLSRSTDRTQTICTMHTSGTLGYMPPEYLRGKISLMSDIYSLGVIIMEVISGHRDYPYDIRALSEGFVELEHKKWRTMLQKKPGYESLEIDCQQIKRCIQVGLICVNPERTKRPTIKQVIDMLQGAECMNWYITNELSSPGVQAEP